METNQIAQNKMSVTAILIAKRVFLIITVVLVIGIIGFLYFDYTPTGYIFAHVGGLGIIGLLAGLSGLIAGKKNYNYSKTFLLAFLLPILLGLIVVGIVFISNGIVYCGGGVSLAVAAIILIIVVLRKKNNLIKKLHNNSTY